MKTFKEKIEIETAREFRKQAKEKNIDEKLEMLEKYTKTFTWFINRLEEINKGENK